MAEIKKKAHVADYKKRTVDEFAKLIIDYPIIGAVNMENLPGPQLQKMRSQLRGSVVLKMTKRRLMKIAIDKAKGYKKGIEELEKYLKGMPALLFSKENPFKLYKTIKKSKSPAPAKAGQTAPKDIIVPAGPTPFAPGPVIGELGALRIKTAVEGGKVSIKEDTTIVKEGEVIKPNVAGLLTRLGIEPMEIGLDLVAVYENGTIYTKSILDIDEEQVLAQLQNAHRWSLNLAVEAGYFTKDTVKLLVPKAFREAKALAFEANIVCDVIVEELVAKAELQGKVLKEEIKYEAKIGLSEALAEQKPAPTTEAKAEEKKKEVKEELSKPKQEIPKEMPKTEKEKDTKKSKVEEKKEVKEEVRKQETKAERKAAEEAKIRPEELKERLERVIQAKKEAIKEVKVQEKQNAEILIDVPKQNEEPEKKKQELKDAEYLLKELQKKGTLRGINPELKIGSKKPSPEEIIKKALKR